MDDFYLTLGIGREADQEEIKRAYRSFCKRHHPDLHPEKPNGNDFRVVREAYETLSDPEKKKVYDRTLAGATATGDTVTVSVRSGEEWFRDESTRQAGWEWGFFSDEERLDVEIVLSPEEARMGGGLHVQIPVAERCFSCSGTGIRYPYLCGICSGSGMTRSMRAVPLHLPAGVRHGSRMSVRLAGAGAAPIVLDILTLIARY